MGTSTTNVRTYRPTSAAVLPGCAGRGFLIAMFYVPVGLLLHSFLLGAFDGTQYDPTIMELHQAIGWGGVTGIAFAFPIAASLLLAMVGYGRRRYELGEDGITERRGLLFTEETFVGYDEIEEVIYTQGRVQSFYNVGTLRLVDVDAAKEGKSKEVMQLSYIENPEAVYTNLFRNITDPTEATARDSSALDVGELPMESEYVSRLSGESLAAGTGFRYMMPSAILHPNSGAAARYGALLGLVYSIGGFFVLDYVRPTWDWMVHIPSDSYYLGLLVVGAIAFAVLMAARYYWKYDRTQYELYDDHVRFIRGDERSTVAMENVHSIERDDGALSWNDVGHATLLDDDGDQLVQFKFIVDLESVVASLDEWVSSDEDGLGSSDEDELDSSGGEEVDPLEENVIGSLEGNEVDSSGEE